jgi:transcription antitermination factor NusA-like protein
MAVAPAAAAAATAPATSVQAAVDAQPFTVAVLRLLIQNNKAGLLIGKGGAGIKAIRDATGAKLYVHDLPPGCTERVVRPCSHMPP